MWLKFLLIWRFFRLWALSDGLFVVAVSHLDISSDAACCCLFYDDGWDVNWFAQAWRLGKT